MKNARLFLYSPGNLVGIGLACLGPLLLFSGVIDRGWWAVSVAGYGMGQAIGRLFFRNVEMVQKTEMTLQDLQHFLDRMLIEKGQRLPPEAFEHLRSISESLRQALPRFQELFGRSGSAGEEWLVFRQVILSYLPETLDNYLRLPGGYAASHLVADTGLTPRRLLCDQLSVMDSELQKVVQGLFESDANQMLVNSKFLEQKFRKAIDYME